MMIGIFIMLCVTFSHFLTINAASIHAHQLDASKELKANDYQLDHPALPRKLLINKKVEGYEAKGFVSPNEQNKVSSAELQKKKGREEVEVMIHATKGTRQEWIEGSDPIHEFFTMDYTHVKRRRPVHNMSFSKTVINSP